MLRPNSSFAADRRCPSVQSNMTSELSQDDARSLLENSQQRWSMTHDQLRSAIFERTTSPMSQAEQQQNARNIATLQQSLAQMEAEMAHYKEQLKHAETTILQQQATIRTQSKAIENPRSGRDFQQSPYHLRASHDALNMASSQRFEPLASNVGRLDLGHGQSHHSRSFLSTSEIGKSNPPAHPGNKGMFGSHSTGHTPSSKAGSNHRRGNEFETSGTHRYAPSITPSTQFGPNNSSASFQHDWQANMSDPFAPNCASLGRSDSRNVVPSYSHGHSITTPESIITNPYLESAVRPSSNPVLCPADANGEKIGELFSKVFDMAQQYARTHANFPSTAGDNALPKETKEKLLKAATTTTAFGLMSDWQTRYLLVAKIILQWIFKHILKFNAFSGLDQDVDNVISGTKAAVYQSTPPQIRFLLLTTAANEMKKIRDRPDFKSYVQHLSEQRAQKLLYIVRPMMHQSPIGEREDLVTLLQEAYRLSELMFIGTNEFRFDFHPVGCNYDANEMTSINNGVNEQRNRQPRTMPVSIRLGTTPLVRVRKNAPDGNSTEHVILKARVLLKG